MADPAPQTISLASGEAVVCRFDTDMWRADVEEYHYCAPTFEGLLNAIGYLHPIRREAPPPAPPPTPQEILQNAPSLADKQHAFFSLAEMAERGDLAAKDFVDKVDANMQNSLLDAVAIVKEIKNTLPENYVLTPNNVNNAAISLAKAANKPDLAYVSPAVILNANYDIVIKNAVLRLLAKRFDLNARS